MGFVQNLEFSGFILYPLSFFLFSPFNTLKSKNSYLIFTSAWGVEAIKVKNITQHHGLKLLEYNNSNSQVPRLEYDNPNSQVPRLEYDNSNSQVPRLEYDNPSSQVPRLEYDNPNSQVSRLE